MTSTERPVANQISTAEQLAIFDTTMRKAARRSRALMRRTNVALRKNSEAVMADVVQRRIQFTDLRTFNTYEPADEELADLLDERGHFGASIAVVFPTPGHVSKVRNALNTRARATALDKAGQRNLWGLWRTLGWLNESAPPVTQHMMVLSRCLGEAFWCVNPDTSRIASWVNAARISNLSLAEQVAHLYWALPTTKADKPAHRHTITVAPPEDWREWFAAELLSAESDALHGCSGYKQSGEALVFQAGETLVELWEAAFGLDPALLERNLVSGAALSIIGRGMPATIDPAFDPAVRKSKGSRSGTYYNIQVAGSGSWRDGDPLLVSVADRYTVSGVLKSATPEVDGVQTLTILFDHTQPTPVFGEADDFTGWVSSAPPRFRGQGWRPRSIWFDSGYKQEPVIERDVPLDVLLAGN